YRVSDRELERLRRKTEEYLTQKGFLQAKVRTELTETEKDRLLTMFIDGGSFTTVQEIQFEGNRSVPASDLEAAMLTHTKGWLPWSKARFSPPVLEADLQAVKGVFALRGFPRARVEETHQLDADGTVRIRIRVEEGIHQRVGRIRFTGQDDMTDQQLLAIADRTGLRPGADLSRTLLGQAAQAITLRYNARGFPDAQLRVQRGDVRGEDVDLSIEVQEGVRQQVGKLIASGNYKTTTKTMIKGFPWEDGDPLSSSRMARLRERQVDIGVMDSVLLEKKPDPDGKTDLIVHVQERRSGSVGASALLDNVGGVGGELQLMHENLLHRGIQGNLEG
ncbi:MAG TPA: POTRA domain-containing protein, partial [Pirellulaceae bacterium]